MQVGGSLDTAKYPGLWQIIKGAFRALGRAGSHRVKNANASFVGASAPIVTGTTFIFAGEPYSGSRARPQHARPRDCTGAAGRRPGPLQAATYSSGPDSNSRYNR